MTELTNEASSTVVVTPVVPDVSVKAAQRWIGYVPPMVQRFAGAVLDTRSAIEKRLGFCPLKELQARAGSAINAASEGLDMLADGLHGIACRLRAAAGAAVDAETAPPKAAESAAPAASSTESPPAQA